jgi:hypothetical protein
MKLPYHLGIHQTLNISTQPERGTAAWCEKTPNLSRAGNNMNPKVNPDAGRTRSEWHTYLSKKRGSKAPNPSYKRSETRHQKKCNQTHRAEGMHLTLNEPETLEGEQGSIKKTRQRRGPPIERTDDVKWSQSKRSTCKKTTSNPRSTQDRPICDNTRSGQDALS